MKKIINIGLAAFMLFAIGACGGKEDGVKSVKIGSQVWMAENLNDASKGGKCHNDKSENCEKYGRLYTWDEAMKACPTGWRLPSDKEWQALVDFAGGKEVAGKKLKAKSGWEKGGNGSDEYGFSALPGGDGRFNDTGNNGYWWSSTKCDECPDYEENDPNGKYAYFLVIGSLMDELLLGESDISEWWCSVRCIKTSEP